MLEAVSHHQVQQDAPQEEKVGHEKAEARAWRRGGASDGG